MAFRAERIREAIWPELLGVGTYAGAEIVAAAIDGARETKEGYPSAQTITTGVALIGGAVGLAYNWAPEFSKGLLYGSGVGMVLTGARLLYDWATRQPARIRGEDFPALIPRRVGALSPGSPAGGGLKLDTRRGLTVYTAPGVPVGAAVGGRGTL